MRILLPAVLSALIGLPAVADQITLAPLSMTEWKAVYGRIEARDRIPARARLGGTLISLTVVEGDQVTAGQVIAEVVDEKLAFQLSAIRAQQTSLQAQLDNAQIELKRGEDLLKQGVTTVQRLDGLRTQVDVLTGQLDAIAAQVKLVDQQVAEGQVLAPVTGRVLDVPAAKGGVVMPGEAVATLGGGGIFLRLAVPERHATRMSEGDTIRIEGADGAREGRLARIYPLIENGRVVADVEVEDLPDTFVDARVLVRLPVSTREAIAVPKAALTTRAGLDFVAVKSGEEMALRSVVPGQHQMIGDVEMVEILSGLQVGDVIETVAPAAKGASHE